MRDTILDAALICLAKGGPDGLTFSEVSRVAKMDRGTPYRYFETREQLIKATAQHVSNKLFDAVFGPFDERADPPMNSNEVLGVDERLINFGMNNPELCRVWLFDILSSDNPSEDPFWKTFKNYMGKFSDTDMSQPNVDVEVLGMISLTSAFLWPIWVNAHARTPQAKRKLGRRFIVETLRHALYGSVKPERFPDLVKLVDEEKLTSAGKGKTIAKAPPKRS